MSRSKLHSNHDTEKLALLVEILSPESRTRGAVREGVPVDRGCQICGRARDNRDSRASLLHSRAESREEEFCEVPVAEHILTPSRQTLEVRLRVVHVLCRVEDRSPASSTGPWEETSRL